MASDSANGGDLQILERRIREGSLPTSPEERAALRRRAADVARSLRPDGKWEAVDYTSELRSDWGVRYHHQRMLLLARSVAIEPDPDHARALQSSLSWWLTTDPKNSNWWHNQIGVPQVLGEIGILMGERLRDADRAKIIEILLRSDLDGAGGQNQVWTCNIHIMRGVLQHDAAVTDRAYRRLYREIKIALPPVEGIMPDGSFHQHLAQLYSGGYGLCFAVDVGRLLVLAAGTAFAPPAEVVEAYTLFMLEGERWMMRGRRFDHSARGREITRVVSDLETPGLLEGLPNIVAALARVDHPRQADYRAFADQLAGGRLSAINGNRHFWCSDYMTHRRDDFFVSIRMYSSRLLNTEVCNDEGRLSHHLADGCTLLYQTGDDYTDVIPVWDWQKIPGTTVAQRPLNSLPANPQVRVPNDFVGGASDGFFGVAVQDFSREELSFRKLWLCLDDGFVALGAGITDTTGVAVLTTLDQTLLTCVPQINERSVRHGDVTYTLLSHGTLHCTAGPQSGRWSDSGTGSSDLKTQDVLCVWLDHGVSPTSADYAYAVLKSDASAKRFSVLSNTSDLQAVRDEAADLLGIAFHAPGVLKIDATRSIAADQSCLVLVRGDRYTVSNPRNAPLVVTLQIDGRHELRFDLPAGPLAGSSVTQSRPA